MKVWAQCSINMAENTKQLDSEYIVHTYARQDVTFIKGKGSYLYDDKGKRYIDFGAGIAVNGLGHNNKAWVDAVTKQVKTIAHTSNLYYSEPCAILAEKLCKKAGMKKVFFGNSGAEANECAIKTARKYASDKGKGTDIITLVNSFHGRTMATLTATGQDSLHKFFNPFLNGFKYVEAGNIDALKDACDDYTCAIMFELVQGEGGVVALDKEYVKKVEEFAKSKGILLIIDEVQTGNGRTGTFFAYEQYGIKPDILTTAKGLANGIPIGACMFNEKTENVLTPGTHGSTFGANLLACAGAIATIDQIDDALLKDVQRKSEIIKEALLKCSKVKSVSGLGLMIGIEVDDAKKVLQKCLKKKLVVLTAHDRVRLLPPLNIDDNSLTKGLSILCEVLK